jgi:hypothetical protein
MIVETTNATMMGLQDVMFKMKDFAPTNVAI